MVDDEFVGEERNLLLGKRARGAIAQVSGDGVADMSKLGADLVMPTGLQFYAH